MADVTIVASEFFTYEFTLYDDSGVMDISDFTTRQLDIRPTDYASALLLDSKALTFTTDGTDGKLDWAVDPADFSAQTAGLAYGQIHLTDGTTIRKSIQFDIMIERNVS